MTEETKTAAIVSCMADGFEKFGADAQVADGEKTFSLAMAKRESELCQLRMRTEDGAPVEGLTLTAEDLPAGLSVTFLREYLVPLTSEKSAPDPVVPIDGAFALDAGECATILVKCTTDETAPAGDHAVTLTLRAANGTALAVYTVQVHIWDFALPEAPGCATAVGLSRDSIADKENAFSDAKIEMVYKQYYDLLLSYKVSAYDLPYGLLTEEVDEYLNDPRVTGFRVPNSTNDDAIRAYYRKLSQNEEWLSKAYFYPLDEPTSKEHLDKLAEHCERLNSLYPDCRICTPYFTDITYSKGEDQIAFMTGKTNLWCPKSFLYEDASIAKKQQASGYDSFGARMGERQAMGDEVWWYVCWEPGNPYCNLFLDQLSIQHRLLFWQQKLCGVTGFLYWNATYWPGVDDPWTDMRTVKELSMSVYGDGSLLYNGSKLGLRTPVASLRLEQIRDGIEDYDLLSLAEQHLGRAYMEEMIRELSPSLTEYDTDTAHFTRVRRAIGDTVEAALAGK